MAYIIKAGSWFEKRKPLKGELDLNHVISGNSAPREASVVSSASITLNNSSSDFYLVTAQAEPLSIENPLNPPATSGIIMYRITDNGVARALTFGSEFRIFGSDPLPTTTVASKTMYISAVRNNTDSKWDILNVIYQP